jgi:hypothetical protein
MKEILRTEDEENQNADAATTKLCHEEFAEISKEAAPSKVRAVRNGINEEDQSDDAEGIYTNGDDGEGHGGYSKDHVGAWAAGDAHAWVMRGMQRRLPATITSMETYNDVMTAVTAQPNQNTDGLMPMMSMPSLMRASFSWPKNLSTENPGTNTQSR